MVFKPARLLTVGDHTKDPHLLDWLKKAQSAYLAESRGLTSIPSGGSVDVGKTVVPPQAFVAPVHFLDRPVSGAVIFALSTKGASRLSAQFRERQINKRYLAVVEDRGHVGHQLFGDRAQGDGEDWQLWVDYLVKDPRTNTVRVVAAPGPKAREFADGPKAQRCDLSVRQIRAFQLADLSGDETHRGHGQAPSPVYRLLEIKLGTGRSHQIRVQCAQRGLPLVGDLKYGARTGLSPGGNHHGAVALHAYVIGFKQPVGDKQVEVYAPVPRRWIEIFGEESLGDYIQNRDPRFGPF